VAPKSPLFCARRSQRRRGAAASSGEEEQVSHRIVGWDELESGVGGWGGGGWATGLQGDTKHTHTHTHRHTRIHSLSGGFWCQLLASSPTNDPRLTHIVSHV